MFNLKSALTQFHTDRAGVISAGGKRRGEKYKLTYRSRTGEQSRQMWLTIDEALERKVSLRARGYRDIEITIMT